MWLVRLMGLVVTFREWVRAIRYECQAGIRGESGWLPAGSGWATASGLAG